MRNRIFCKAAAIIMTMSLGICLCGCADSSGGKETDTETTSEANTDKAEEADTDMAEESDTETADDTDKENDAEEASPDTAVENSTETVSETGVNDTEDAVLTAHEVVSDMSFGLSIGNSLDAYDGTAGQLRNDGLDTENVWGNPDITEEYVDKVKAAGINVIRIPVTWYTHMDPETYEIDPEWMERVADVVSYALDEDTYVILNMHHDTGKDGWLKASDNDLEWKEQVFKQSWEQIAGYFEDYDDHLLFEGFNELLNDYNEWNNPDKRALEIDNELNQIFVDTVRSTGGYNPERVLLVTPYAAGVNVGILKGFEMPEDTADDRLIAEVHAYVPYEFTAPEKPDVTTWDEDDVAGTFKFVNNKFAQTDTPVIVGEFGATPKNNDEELQAWAKYYIETAEGYGMPCCWWDNGMPEEYGLFDRNTGEVYKQELLDVVKECILR